MAGIFSTWRLDSTDLPWFTLRSVCLSSWPTLLPGCLTSLAYGSDHDVWIWGLTLLWFFRVGVGVGAQQQKQSWRDSDTPKYQQEFSHTGFGLWLCFRFLWSSQFKECEEPSRHRGPLTYALQEGWRERFIVETIGAPQTQTDHKRAFSVFFLSAGGRCHKRAVRQGKYTVVFLRAGTNVVPEAALKPDKIMNEILKSPELLPPLTLYGKKERKNKTMSLCGRLLLLLPFLLFHSFFFSTISVLFPLLLLSAVLFYVIYMSSPRPVRGSLRWGHSPETLWWLCVCVCVCDPHQSTLTQWALCACTRFITPPLVTSLPSSAASANLAHTLMQTHTKQCWYLCEDTQPSLAASTYDYMSNLKQPFKVVRREPICPHTVGLKANFTHQTQHNIPAYLTETILMKSWDHLFSPGRNVCHGLCKSLSRAVAAF